MTILLVFAGIVVGIILTIVMFGLFAMIFIDPDIKREMDEIRREKQISDVNTMINEVLKTK